MSESSTHAGYCSIQDNIVLADTQKARDLFPVQFLALLILSPPASAAPAVCRKRLCVEEESVNKAIFSGFIYLNTLKIAYTHTNKQEPLLWRTVVTV